MFTRLFIFKRSRTKYLVKKFIVNGFDECERLFLHFHGEGTRPNLIVVHCCSRAADAPHAPQVNEWLGSLIQIRGEDLYRMKGILAITGFSDTFVFQARAALPIALGNVVHTTGLTPQLPACPHLLLLNLVPAAAEGSRHVPSFPWSLMPSESLRDVGRARGGGGGGGGVLSKSGGHGLFLHLLHMVWYHYCR